MRAYCSLSALRTTSQLSMVFDWQAPLLPAARILIGPVSVERDHLHRVDCMPCLPSAGLRTRSSLGLYAFDKGLRTKYSTSLSCYGFAH